MEYLRKTSLVLTIIGALNWLLVGAFQLDLVAMIFGSTAAIGSRIVYGLVGLAGLWSIGILANLFRNDDVVVEHN